MRLKILFSLSFFFLVFCSHSQVKPHAFGEPFPEEFAMRQYAKDSTATGVILYERGNYSFDAADGYIRLIKDVHRKIKVFDSKNFDYASFEIPYYREKEVQENIRNLTAITHNGKSQTYVADNAFFDIKEGPNYSIKKFTFPNIQDGSILEYTYRLETPYFFNLRGWAFMNDLPTLYSELHTEIPGNYTYNRTLFGDRKLDINEAEIKLSCFHLPGYKVPGDCESATYAMKDVPAFEEEKYMLSKYNYIPAMKFEIRDILKIDETREAYSRTWKDVDKTFRYDKDFGGQLKHTKFFQQELPTSISSITDDLERAKAVYYFIQERMSWNKQSNLLNDNRVKSAFENKRGNSVEINLGLINALEASGLEAKIMLVATRDKAMPTKQYPVRTDFNYALVRLKVNNKIYLLDATNKYTPFGVLPLRTLNKEGRVLDFKKGSYWEPITPISKNMHYVNMQLSANASGLFSGKVNEASTGYISVVQRQMNNDFIKEEIIKRKQSRNEGLEVSNLTVENEKNLDKAYKETYQVSLHEQPVVDKLFLYPFLMETFFSENPFLKNKRHYPIDFGFPVLNNYLVSIDLKDQYVVEEVPNNKILKLPENDGELSVVYDVSGTKVNIRLSVKLNNYHFPPEAYKSLQEFFGALIKIQSEEPIRLKKV
ncbi:transglutaminase domain-containing protein [Aequorivita marina]|uniref:transglutaminase domain-containing protein n=1 Tax=Aequorivita marina TaxID=3073654 RepID=UPI002876DECC|nr:DUF3857 domain-containing protein [Aequorivita sp. S2608]MDS1296835.1 DUF3857 domain-containing protein [Aequorivita sp. S2608]